MSADLAKLQHDFTLALLDIDALAPALASFKGDIELNRERFAHYRGNAVATWQKTCAAAFPVLQSLVGEDFFAELSRQYGLAYPSPSGDLSEFGASMPAFIAELEQCRGYPFLPDVVALEWQVHRTYHAARREPLTLDAFAAQAPEHLMASRYGLQPACALFTSRWAVAAIWLAHQLPEVILPEQIEQESICVIWREAGAWDVRVSPVSAASYAALQAVQAGSTLGEALEAALTIDPEFAVQTEIAGWLQQQLLVSRSPHQELL